MSWRYNVCPECRRAEDLAAPIDPTTAGVSDRERLAPAPIPPTGAAGEPNPIMHARRGRGPGR